VRRLRHKSASTYVNHTFTGARCKAKEPPTNALRCLKSGQKKERQSPDALLFVPLIDALRSFALHRAPHPPERDYLAGLLRTNADDLKNTRGPGIERGFPFRRKLRSNVDRCHA